MVEIWKMEDRHFCHQQHTFKWISNRYILMSIFLVFIAPVCLKKKLHTSFPPNQRRLCEIPKDERKKKNTHRSKFVFFFSFRISREVEKDKMWDAIKDRGGKQVYLKKIVKVREQLLCLLTTLDLTLCPHQTFWQQPNTYSYWAQTRCRAYAVPAP